MAPSMPNGWTKTAQNTSRFGERLHLFFRPAGADWRNWALAYWNHALPELQQVASSPHTRVHRAALPGGPTCYFKRYFFRDWRDLLKHIVRLSRARRAILAGEMVDALGFAAPRTLCLIEQRAFGFIRRSVLVTEALEDAPDVRAWLTRPELGVASNRDAKRAFLRAFAREVGAWHKAGLYHGDMRLGNILAREHAGRFTFIWLDNERTRRYARLPGARRVQNLMQVNMETRGVTLSDRMRFWRAYAEAAGIPPADEKRILRRVMNWTRARWRKRGWL